MATFNIELSSSARKDGRHNLVVRITCDRKHKRKAINKYIRKEDFNPKAPYGKWIRTSCLDHILINKFIKGKIDECEHAVEILEKENILVTGENILRKLNVEKSRSFIQYYINEIENYKSKQQYRTADKHRYILQKFVKYLNNKDITFQEFDKNLLKKYHAYLRRELNNGINTVHTDLKGMKTIFNKAIEDRLILIDENPFVRYKIETERSYKEKLSPDEIHKISELNYSVESNLWNVKNYFLFSFYSSGTRFSDLTSLQVKNIAEGRIQYRMAKNRKLVETNLSKEALKILKLYNIDEKQPNDFVFPILDGNLGTLNGEILLKKISSKNASVNKLLKQIQFDAKLNKNLTFHVARHSFAFIAYKKTKDIDSIRLALKHSKIEETKNYLTDLGIGHLDKFLDEVYN